jgi:hypothetical protein
MRPNLRPYPVAIDAESRQLRPSNDGGLPIGEPVECRVHGRSLPISSVPLDPSSTGLA